MPRYFFTVTDGISSPTNVAGEELPDAAAARERALAIGDEFGRTRAPSGRWLVQVTDDRTRHAFSVAFPLREGSEDLGSLDKLTTVSDRHGFVERLEALRRRNPTRTVLVLKTDIRAFHEINISYGYEAGDAVLVETAARLGSVRDTVVGRLGGNEFAVCTAVDDEASGAALVALIASRLSSVVVLTDASIRVRFALGYAFSSAGMETMTLLRRAGTALVRSKASPLLNVTAFDEATASEIRKRLHLTADLHQAIARREFIQHYQCKVDLKSGVITDAEALIRWNHPVRGTLSPDEFIPVAEKTGLIIDIDRWTACTALDFAVKINRGRARPVGISINISAVELLRPEFIRGVMEVLRQTEVDPSWVTLELTESFLADTTPATIGKLMELRRLGLGLAVDDFGAAYSSLQYLERFPVTEIKIDKCFIRGMTTSGVKREIVASVVRIGHELGAKVTAEGIETREEWQMLRDAHCDSGQGYLFSRPIPGPDFERLLNAEAETVNSPCNVPSSPSYA
jgi:diguanylate cyclase (GGDEF)-like protein